MLATQMAGYDGIEPSCPLSESGVISNIRIAKWQSHQDFNLVKALQRRPCLRYTMGPKGGPIFVKPVGLIAIMYSGRQAGRKPHNSNESAHNLKWLRRQDSNLDFSC